jgi:hypothetical protein
MPLKIFKTISFDFKQKLTENNKNLNETRIFLFLLKLRLLKPKEACRIGKKKFS